MTGEQLSANLASAGRQVSDWFSGLSVKKLHFVICSLLAVWVLVGLAQLVGVLLPAPVPEVEPSVATDGTPGKQPSGNVDIASLQALDLFGAAGEAAEQAAQKPVQPEIGEAELNAEKTRLNLVLEGIVYSPDAADSAAVIVAKGKQELFQVGDTIPVGNQVTLSRVLLDRVILDNNGNYESLWLYDDDKSSGGAMERRRSRPGRDRVSDMRDNSRITDMAESYRERLMDNPSSLAQVIRIAPVQENGEMIGYRISPGKDREQFQALGLKPGDVVTSINGIQLNEPSNALEIYKLMRSATEASFTIDRNGSPVEILVSLGATE